MKLEDIKVGAFYKYKHSPNVVGVCLSVEKPTTMYCGVKLEFTKEASEKQCFMWSYDGSNLEPATLEERQAYLQAYYLDSVKQKGKEKSNKSKFQQLSLFDLDSISEDE